jgi:hypothetical protein
MQTLVLFREPDRFIVDIDSSNHPYLVQHALEEIT